MCVGERGRKLDGEIEKQTEKSPHPLPCKLLSLSFPLSPPPPWSLFILLLLSISPGEERPWCDKKARGRRGEADKMERRGEEKGGWEINGVDTADELNHRLRNERGEGGVEETVRFC